MTNKQLATAIAKELFFSNRTREPIVRLQLKTAPPNWNGKLNYDIKLEGDAGGLCFDATVRAVLDVLERVQP